MGATRGSWLTLIVLCRRDHREGNGFHADLEKTHL